MIVHAGAMIMILKLITVEAIKCDDNSNDRGDRDHHIGKVALLKLVLWMKVVMIIIRDAFTTCHICIL